MPLHLHRYYGSDYLHFITTSCYQRRPILDHRIRRELLLQTLEQVRRRYRFVVVGYVVMPEHVHLLLSKPERADPSVVMQVWKQSFARKLGCVGYDESRVWQRRFYDFVVWSEKKRIEKLNYMHFNPVKRGLVEAPELWLWSSSRYYAFGEGGTVLINEQIPVKLRTRETGAA